MSKPITLFSHAQGPNPWKVEILLEELELPFERELIDMKDMHTPIYEKHNPNGRTPAIHDPNTGITLWESGAIIEYLIAEYDKSHKLSFTSAPEKYYALQFLHFQVSGQGPYFGQFAWFSMFHSEKLPSAIERYKNEIKRVTGVLDDLLKDKDYLVGGKASFADLCFVTWYWVIPFLDSNNELKLEETYPNWAKWNKTLNARPAVKKAAEARMKILSGGGH